MNRLPYELYNKIYYNYINIFMINNGWKNIHEELLNFIPYLKKTNFIFPLNIKFIYAIRAHKIRCDCERYLYNHYEYEHYLFYEYYDYTSELITKLTQL